MCNRYCRDPWEQTAPTETVIIEITLARLNFQHEGARALRLEKLTLSSAALPTPDAVRIAVPTRRACPTQNPRSQIWATLCTRPAQTSSNPSRARRTSIPPSRPPETLRLPRHLRNVPHSARTISASEATRSWTKGPSYCPPIAAESQPEKCGELLPPGTPALCGMPHPCILCKGGEQAYFDSRPFCEASSRNAGLFFSRSGNFSSYSASPGQIA